MLFSLGDFLAHRLQRSVDGATVEVCDSESMYDTSHMIVTGMFEMIQRGLNCVSSVQSFGDLREELGPFVEPGVRGHQRTLQGVPGQHERLEGEDDVSGNVG